MSKAALIFLLITGFGCLSAQEQLGVRLDSYTGMQTALLNPAHTINSPQKWTINLAGAGLFFDNSYLYAGNAGTLKMLRNPEKIKVITDYKNTAPPTDAMLIDFYRNYKSAYLDFQTKINGPAVSVHLGNRHSVGLFYNASLRLEAPRIPQSMNFHTLNELPEAKEITVEPVQLRMMAWDEIGCNYAYRWETDKGSFQAGLNLKYLRGFEAAYLSSDASLTYSRTGNQFQRFSRPDAALAYTTGNFENLDAGKYGLIPQGRGVGIDMGFSWIAPVSDNNYAFRFSAALNDIGKITFTPTAAYHYINKIKGDHYNLNAQLDAVKTLGQGIAKLTEIATGDSLNTLKSNSFAIATPMSLCLMADYRFYKNAYISFIVQQRVLQQSSPLHRGNMIAAAVRYEHRWFSATIPLSWYNYKHFRTGLAARLGFITIGTDDFFSWRKKREWTGTDFYIAVLLNPVDLKLTRGGPVFSRAKNIRCFQF